MTLPLVQRDEWLSPVEGELNNRYDRFLWRIGEIDHYSGSLCDFANAHLFFGVHFDPIRQGWWIREWLPGAKHVTVFGDWNNWDKEQYSLSSDEWGIWSIFIPGDTDLDSGLHHKSLIKLHVIGADDSRMDRIPAYIRRAVQDEDSKDFCGQIWRPNQKFDWGDDEFHIDMNGSPVIYEAHIGMAHEKEGVASYRAFEQDVLPRIKRLGYNVVQLMAIAEHPYYGSFGYHVSNFFAPSSRFGTPEDLKSLIKTAHSMGIAVIMDIVHSHYIKNTAEGINRLDGTDNLYSKSGSQGNHPHWDSKLFDYSKHEVQHFLLSNLKYWLEEFHFDGFRFDGVSSMIYFHHGYAHLSDPYKLFFGDGVDNDAILYLTLANKLIKEIKPSAITIAEDVSGMPGMAVSISDGGIGFDYRLAMAIPDFWIRYLKEVPDESWNIEEMWDVMNSRLTDVKTIAYAESHDQALVGDKTIAFRLMDSHMYSGMGVGSRDVVIDRGIALHKMIRLYTISLGGNAYMNFMGNEFGHPEWIDFPRAGNNWSYHYARRQWGLVSDTSLRYHHLELFDFAMIKLIRTHHVLRSGYAYNLLNDHFNQTQVYEQSGLVFVFNWSSDFSVVDYLVPVPVSGIYRQVLCSDSELYGGFGRVDSSIDHFSHLGDDGHHYISIYNVSRSVQVFELV